MIGIAGARQAGADDPGATIPAAGRADSAAAPRADTLAARPDSVWTLADRGVVVGPGTGRGQVVEPAGLAVDAFGRLYVSDAALHRLQRFEPNGVPSAEAGALGGDPNQMRHPTGVALLGSLGVAVLDVENRRVLSFDQHTRLIGTFVDLAAPDLEQQIGRVDPVGLAADRGGAVVVADRESDRLIAFDFSGRFLRTIGGYGTKPGSFRGLAAVAATPRGDLVTAERGAARVQRLDASGRSLAAWPLPARVSGALAVAVDDSGRVAVADEAGGRVWLFAADGAPIATATGLGRPRAIAFAADGALLVAETVPGRVRRWVPVRAPSAGAER